MKHPSIPMQGEYEFENLREKNKGVELQHIIAFEWSEKKMKNITQVDQKDIEDKLQNRLL